MSNYSKGVIAIPSVNGNIVITVTTAGQAANLFDPTKATYNARISSSGAISQTSATKGIVVTGPIDISQYSTLTVSGITEIYHSGYYYYAVACTYSDSEGTTKVNLMTYTNETYTFDVALMKTQYPAGTYIRLGFVLSSSEISTADTANLTIYGS